MLPAILSYGAIILLIVLSMIDPFLAAIYLLAVIITTLVKALGIAFHTISGRNNLERAQKVDWHHRLASLENPKGAYEKLEDATSDSFGFSQHVRNLKQVADAPSEYPTLPSVADTEYDNSHLIIVLAYEERGGEAMEKTAKLLQEKYSNQFKAFHLVKHPKDLAEEVRGKGGNITYAGQYLKEWLKKQQISYSDVIVTTLDSDNRPHKTYFDYVTYEYIIRTDRKNLSYQPVSLFLNNIWDAPAPMRVVATGNSFWNIISSMRPHTLRNFASHSQPMDALVDTPI